MFVKVGGVTINLMEDFAAFFSVLQDCVYVTSSSVHTKFSVYKFATRT